MRILQVAPLWEDVPPPKYGGTEAVVHLLTEQLVAAGHEVTLAASGSSSTSARLKSVYGRSLRSADDLKDRNPYDWQHIASALRQARHFDIVHNHAGELAMAMACLIDTPMLTTMHCLNTPDTKFVWDRYEGAFNTISAAQYSHMLPVVGPSRFVGHVYNAIDVASFPFDAVGGDDLLFLSRISWEKGPHHAVAVARATGRRLIIAGKVDRADQRYFDEVLRGLIDGEQIVFFGEADAVQKRELYRRAYALLMPLEWEEPFGLVIPEAMACGTPVIAFRRGSVPELIADGTTGYVVRTREEMADAVAGVRRIDRARCRAHVEAHFAPEIMTGGYVRLYEALAHQRTPIAPVLPAAPHTAPAAPLQRIAVS